MRKPWLALAAVLGLLSAPMPAGALVVGQNPCAANDIGACMVLGADNTPVPVLRSITTGVRETGNILVTFHGSMYCASQVSGMRVVDLATQITTENAEATVTGPSGLRHVAIFYNVDEGVSFNLSSTRVVRNARKSIKTFRFKLNRLRQDAGVTCYLYNLTFAVTTPD